MQDQVDSAISILTNGGVVAVPTDTVYGLAACVFDTVAVKRVFDLKRRPEGMALPLLLAESQDLSRYAAHVPDVAWLLVERFWPGALTIIVRKVEEIADLASGGKSSIALRVPDHPIPREIVRGLGAPITGTSANRTGEPSATTSQGVIDQFGSDIDLVVDAGATPAGRSSTVLDLTGKVPRFIRQGAILRQDIEELCGLRLAG